MRNDISVSCTSIFQQIFWCSFMFIWCYN